MLGQAEYIWLDGNTPTQELRSKTRIVQITDSDSLDPNSFPRWSYDGSSTYQSSGGDSDLLLNPVRAVRDPIRGASCYLVMCEVLNPDGTPHDSNTRSQLRSAIRKAGHSTQPWIGFEQEYTLFRDDRPLGFPEDGFPAPQGPYYCSVGADRAFGRLVVESHTRACLDAGIMIYGINAEVMPGQWEFQIGYRGLKDESADPLTVADHLWLARWLLHRISEQHDVVTTFDVKPVKGDWNGAGCHTNFSTAATRSKTGGVAAIHDAIESLRGRHELHVAEYGAGLVERLTGLHETCSIHEFRDGVADRGASIRIPRQVQEKGCGYIEDRRPGANCDPYRVSALLIEAVSLNATGEFLLAG